MISTFAALLFVARSATGAAVEISACSEPDAAAIRDRLDDELRTRHLDGDAIRLSIACGSGVRIAAWLAEHDARAVRDLAIDGIPPHARARIIALAAIELMEELRTPLAAPPPRAAATAVAPKAPRASDEAEWRAGIFTRMERFEGRLGWVPSAGVALAWEPATVGYQVALAAHHVTRDLSAGQGRVAGGTIDLSLFHRRGTGPVALIASAGGRAAVTHFRGRAEASGPRGRQFWSGWGGAGGAVIGDLDIGRLWFGATWARRFSLQAGYTLGYTLASAAGLSKPGESLALSGWWHGPYFGITAGLR